MKIYCQKCQKVVEPEIPAEVQKVPCPLCSAEINVPEGPLAPGAVIGDFLLEKPLSSGGMGMVYLARQISLDRPVALKVLHEKFAANQEYIQGLFHEARAAAKLTHPHIVQAYAVGEENGIFYFAMEYIRGETFKQVLKKQKVLDFDQAIKVIREICSALQVAWDEQKLVHQDIKPDNIMLDSNGFAKLSDLGLARSANNESVSTDDENTVMGTPQYISPEQLTGVPTDVRSDIYSLGATFYQFVTGQFPYPAETAEEMARLHEAGNLTPPIEINPELPRQLSDIIVKMMARNIEMRYQTPNEVIADLNAYRDAKKVPTVAVPKIKLNLNKTPGSGAMPPPVSPIKPGNPALRPGLKVSPAAPKPAASVAPKPATPAVSKPAAPVAPKPAAPAAPKPVAPPPKPAAPAAPKPATPAPQPAAPEAPKPATPAPATPEPPKQQESATAPKQPAASDEITLAPKAEKPKTSTDEAEGNNKDSGKKQDKKKEEKKGRERRSPSKVGTILSAVLIPSVLVAIAATLFVMGHKGILGEKGKKISAQVAAALKIKLPEPAPSEKISAPTATTGTAAVQLPAAPALPPPPQTRPEFVSKADRLIVFYRTDPEKNSVKFLEDTEKFKERFKSPVTSEEMKIFQTLRKIYAQADEGVRARPFRDKEIRKVQKWLAEKEQAKIAEQQKREREAREREEQRKKALERDAKIIAARKERLSKLTAELSVIHQNLGKTFVEAVRKNDFNLLKQEIDKVQEYTVSEENAFLVDEHNHFKRFLPVAFKQFEKFSQHLKTITPETGFYVGPRLDIRVVRVAPPEGVFKETPKGEAKVYLTAEIRSDIYIHMNKKFKMRNAAFYFEFLNGNRRFIANVKDSMLPSSDWKKFLKFFQPYIRISSSRSKR